MRRIIAVLALALFAAGAIFAYQSGGASAPGAAPTASPVPRVPVSADVVAEARAVPVRTAVLGASAAGTVKRAATLGQQVAAGDVLLSLDTATADAQVVGAQAAVDAATAQRDQAAAAVSQADAAISIAQASVRQSQANVDVAKAAVSQAQANVDAAQGSVDQADAARDALPSGASAAQKRQANAAVAVATAQLAAAKDAVDQANAQLEAAQAAVDQATGQVASTTAAKTVAQHAADAADATRIQVDASLTAARAARDAMTVTAPFAGTIAAAGTHVGEQVAPGPVLFRLADLSAWTFETTDLAEAGVARLAPGDPATVTVEDVPGLSIAGRVQQIGAYATDSQGDVVYRVIVEPTATVPPTIRWNTVVTVTIRPAH